MKTTKTIIDEMTNAMKEFEKIFYSKKMVNALGREYFNKLDNEFMNMEAKIYNVMIALKEKEGM